MQGDVTAQPVIHRRFISKYRRSQSNQLQHAFRSEDADDDLSGNRSARRDVVAVDRRQLGAQSVREASILFRFIVAVVSFTTVIVLILILIITRQVACLGFQK